MPATRRIPRHTQAVSVLLLAGLVVGAAPRSQETPPPTSATAPAPPLALLGLWKGSATLTNDAPSAACRYEGAAEPPAVTVKLSADEGHLRVVLRLDTPGATGSNCPPLRKRYEIADVQVTDSTVAFTDPAGHDWSLGLREGRLVGLVAWKGGGKDEPLAEGFAPPGAAVPLTRLSGEVALARSEPPPGEAGPAPAPAGSSTATDQAKKGTKSHFLPAFLAANVIGLGAFYGIKKATDDTGSGGNATCSPRYCAFGGLSDPCVCTINITSGAPCGLTASGVPFGGFCNDKRLLCQAGLSCNNNVCDDRTGRCPF